MLYLLYKPYERQEIRISRTASTAGVLHLEFRQADFSQTLRLEDATPEAMYVTLYPVVTEEMATGEYVYTLTNDGGEVLSRGVAHVVWDRPTVEAEQTNVIYEQYND